MSNNDPSKDRFSDDELRDLLTNILVNIRGGEDATEAYKAELTAEVRPVVDAAIEERNKNEAKAR